MAFDSALRIVVDTRTGERSLRRFRGELQQTESRGKRTFDSLGKVALGFSGVIAGLGLGRIFTSAIKNAADYEAQMLSLDSVIRATGASAGFTAGQLEEQARALAFATLQSTEGVLSAQRVLLTFRSVTGDTFREAIGLSADLSTVFGTSMSQSATQLGKALEDPVRGITALRRSGVSFTESQKDTIQALVETNRQAEAQALILGELQRQVGGAAEGQAGGLAGAFDTLGQSVEEFGLAMTESLGQEGGLLVRYLDLVTRSVQNLEQALFPDDTLRAAQLWNDIEELQGRINEMEEGGVPSFRTRVYEGLKSELEEAEAEYQKLVDRREAQRKADAEAEQAAIDAEIERRKEAEREKAKLREEIAQKVHKEQAEARATAVAGITEQLQNELLALSLTERELLSHEMAVAGATSSERELALATFDASQKLRDQARAAEEAAEAQQDYERRLSTLKGRLDPVAEDFERFANSAALLRLALE
ncbi:MAG: phage tail length tape measure family protein, partial [Marinobacter sp.]|uniref:phage tail length tape measure family protein n=1 Tax=Marinobacter sp. TaxID=50741 RepID=UPI003C421B50